MDSVTALSATVVPAVAAPLVVVAAPLVVVAGAVVVEVPPQPAIKATTPASASSAVRTTITRHFLPEEPDISSPFYSIHPYRSDSFP